MEKTGVCPIRSRDILEFALNALRQRGAFPRLPEEAYRKEAEALEALLPDRLFPEVYLDGVVALTKSAATPYIWSNLQEQNRKRGKAHNNT